MGKWGNVEIGWDGAVGKKGVLEDSIVRNLRIVEFSIGSDFGGLTYF